MRIQLTLPLCAFVLGLAVLQLASSASVQSGRRFPLGVQLGQDVNGTVSCETEEDIGLLRFHENHVEVCQQVGESVGFIVVGSNETVVLNNELIDMRNRLDELETSNEVGLGPRLDESNGLQAITMCNLHGVYNRAERRCECDCDSVLGCWNFTTFCTTCHEGWTGEFCLGDIESPEISLLGSAVTTHEAGEQYVDAGAEAYDNKDLDVTSTIQVVGSVLDDVVGNYTLTYEVTDLGGNFASVYRVVHVVDTTPPTVVLHGSVDLTMEAGSEWVEEGYTASDNAVGVLSVTSNVESTNFRLTGLHTVVYELTDAAGNVAIPQTRSVTVVDTTDPVIELYGHADIYHVLGIVYDDDGAEILDNSDDFPLTLSADSTVNHNAVGNYTVTFSGNDASGNVAAQVVRTVRVRDRAASCEGMVSSAPESYFESGVFGVDPSGTGSVVDTFCYFHGDSVVGYDLLFTLDTSDSVARTHGSSFWTSSATVGSTSHALQAEYKGSAFSTLTNLTRVLIMYHDGSGDLTSGIIGTAEYSVREAYYESTFYSLLSGESEIVLSYEKENEDHPIGFRSPSSHSALIYDMFMERSEPLVINRLAAFNADTNLNRLATTRVRNTETGSGHQFGGIGGRHIHSGWGIDYEVAAHEQYCDLDSIYSSSSSTLAGVMQSNGQSNYHLQTNCVDDVGALGGIEYRPIDVSVFAVGGVPSSEHVVVDTCDAYLQRNPLASDGHVSLLDGREAYCVFSGGKGFHVLFNLETSDSVSRYYSSGFWTQLYLEGSVTNALGAEFKGMDYLYRGGAKEFMVLYHSNGVYAHNATYDALPVVGELSMREMVRTFADTTVSSGKTNSHSSMGYRSQTHGGVGFDPFMETSEALMINRQSAFGSDLNKNRLSTAITSVSGTGSGHQFGGVGGEHIHSGWGIRFELHGHEQYCDLDFVYSSSISSSQSGNYQSNSQANYHFQSNCVDDSNALGGIQVIDVDMAFLARF